MNTLATMNNSPIRTIKARVELYEGSTLIDTIPYDGDLISFKVERLGEEGKFFGFGISQKLTIQLRDPNSKYEITEAHSFKVLLTDTDKYYSLYPRFYVKDVKRDENNNNLTITAYDLLEKASAHTIDEINITDYTTLELTQNIALALGFDGLSFYNLDPQEEVFNVLYENGANFEGTEDLRSVFNAIAELTTSIYYAEDNYLAFKRLNKDGAPVLTIGKADYFTLTSGENRKLTTIHHTTELGDDIIASTGEDGEEQYLRDNPFLNLRNDVADLLRLALDSIAGTAINQFSCSWRGNYLLEIGDKIALVTKNDTVINSYVLNDSINYTGGFKEDTKWEYKDTSKETPSNPVTLGEALKQTFAKVDKANKQIDMVASEVDVNSSAISALQINTQSITATVTETKQELDEINNGIADLTSKVEAQITSEEVRVEIQNEIQNGVDKVITGKGYSLTDTGLTIEDLNPDSNKNIKTTVSNNGMGVYSEDERVLTANDEGVLAKDLHATTYLIVGNNSRFENYTSNRTACFWIGGRS